MIGSSCALLPNSSDAFAIVMRSSPDAFAKLPTALVPVPAPAPGPVPTALLSVDGR